jgi:hypothetical protein
MALRLIRRFNADPLISHGRLPQGVMRSISKSSADSICQWRRTGVHGLTEVHYHHSTTLPAQEEKSKRACEQRKPLSDFTVAAGQGLQMADGRQVLEIAGANIFSKFVTGGNGLPWKRGGERFLGSLGHGCEEFLFDSVFGLGTPIPTADSCRFRRHRTHKIMAASSTKLKVNKA